MQLLDEATVNGIGHVGVACNQVVAEEQERLVVEAY